MCNTKNSNSTITIAKAIYAARKEGRSFFFVYGESFSCLVCLVALTNNSNENHKTQNNRKEANQDETDEVIVLIPCWTRGVECYVCLRLVGEEDGAVVLQVRRHER